MATNEFNKQFNLNADTVAAFAGLRILEKPEAEEIHIQQCPLCNKDVEEMELKSDGICNKCFFGKDK